MSVLCFLTWIFLPINALAQPVDTQYIPNFSGYLHKESYSQQQLEFGVSINSAPRMHFEYAPGLVSTNSSADEWMKLGLNVAKQPKKFSYKEFFQVKYEYFVVGLYKQKGIGLGPMIEVQLNRNTRIWALAPIISKKSDPNIQFGIGLSMEF